MQGVAARTVERIEAFGRPVELPRMLFTAALLLALTLGFQLLRPWAAWVPHARLPVWVALGVGLFAGLLRAVLARRARRALPVDSLAPVRRARAVVTVVAIGALGLLLFFLRSPLFDAAQRLRALALIPVGLLASLLIFRGRRFAGKSIPPPPRRKRRLTLPTFITIVGTAVGVWALIVVLSVMRGFGEDLRTKILQVDAHVHVESASLDQPLPEPSRILEALRQDPRVADVEPMVMGRAIFSTPFNTSASVDVKGIDPWSMSRAPALARIMKPAVMERLAYPEELLPDSEMQRGVAEALAALERKGNDPSGDPGEDDDDEGFTAPSRLFGGVILGSELADSLQVSVGHTVELITPDGDETPFGVRPRTRTFRVAGIFHTGMYQYDLRLAYVAWWDAASLFRIEGGPNRIEVTAREPEESPAILAALKSQVDPARVEVRDWHDMNQALLSALALERLSMFFVLGFIVLVASFNIVGSQVMIILEKAREIAILRAMGGTARWVARVFSTVAAFIGCIGVGTGLGLGLLSCFLIATVGIPLPHEYYVENIPVNVDPLTVAVIAGSASLVIALASIYPTVQAARLVPSEGLRHE